MSDNKSILALSLWGKRTVQLDPQGHFYFDRNPNLFKFIVNYLETKGGIDTLNTPDEINALNAEADFFQLAQLKDDLETRLQALCGGFYQVGKGREFETIRDAVALANEGECVVIYPGVYTESVVLTKKIRLLGKPGPGSDDSEKVFVESAQKITLTITGVGARIEHLCLRRVAEDEPGRRATAVCRCGHVEIVHNTVTGCDLCDDCTVMSTPEGVSTHGPCVQIRGEGKLVMHECRVQCNVGNSVEVMAGGFLDVRHSTLCDAVEMGLSVHGKAKLKFCHIQRTGLAGLGVHTGGEVTIQRSDFCDGQDCGIVVDNGGKITMSGSEAARNAAAGIGLSGCAPGDVLLRNCQVFGNGHAGVYATAGAFAQLVGLHLSDNGLAGIASVNGANPTVQNCNIYNNKGCGVLLHQGGLCQVVRSDIYCNRMAGVAVQGKGTSLKLLSCLVRDGLDAGVFVNDSATCTIKLCDIRNNALAGIATGDAGRPIVQDCDIHHCRVGISAFNLGQGQFERVDVFNNVTANATVETSADTQFLRCKLRDSETGCGLLVERGGVPVLAGCTITGNQLAGVIVRDKGSKPSLSENEISGNSGAAVLCSDGGGGSFDRDMIVDNKGVGIVIKTNAHPSFTNCTIKGNTSVGVASTDMGRGAILGCLIEKCGGGFVCGPNARTLVKECAINSCGDCGVLVLPGGQCELHSNNITKHAIAGVVLRQGADPRVFENTISDSGNFGILCCDGAFGTLEYNNVGSGDRAALGLCRKAQPVLLYNDLEQGADGDAASYGPPASGPDTYATNKTVAEDHASAEARAHRPTAPTSVPTLRSHTTSSGNGTRTSGDFDEGPCIKQPTGVHSSRTGTATGSTSGNNFGDTTRTHLLPSPLPSAPSTLPGAGLTTAKLPSPAEMWPVSPSPKGLVGAEWNSVPTPKGSLKERQGSGGTAGDWQARRQSSSLSSGSVRTADNSEKQPPQPQPQPPSAQRPPGGRPGSGKTAPGPAGAAPSTKPRGAPPKPKIQIASPAVPAGPMSAARPPGGRRAGSGGGSTVAAPAPATIPAAAPPLQ